MHDVGGCGGCGADGHGGGGADAVAVPVLQLPAPTEQWCVGGWPPHFHGYSPRSDAGLPLEGKMSMEENNNNKSL